MNKKMAIMLTLISIFSYTNVLAAPNIKTEATKDADTIKDKCPVSVIIQDNLKGEKDMDFSDFDCMFYKMDDKGNYILDENGEKILRDENENVSFGCVQSFLEKYTNEEYKEAANNKPSEGEEGFIANPYCPVYCIEENKFFFPGYAPSTNSGGHFTWTIGKNEDKSIINGLTVRLHGIKSCRVNVDLEKWVKDYVDLIEEIESSIHSVPPTMKYSQSCTPNANAYGGNMANSSSGWAEATDSPLNDVTMEITFTQAGGEKMNSLGSGDIELSEITYNSGGNHLTTTLSGMFFDGASANALTSFDRSVQVDGDSNRLYFVIEEIDEIDNSKSYQDNQITTTARMTANGLRMTDLKGGTYNAITTPIGSKKYRIRAYERHCCAWVPDQMMSPTFSTLTPNFGNYSSIPQDPSVTFGYKLLSTKFVCSDGGIKSNLSDCCVEGSNSYEVCSLGPCKGYKKHVCENIMKVPCYAYSTATDKSCKEYPKTQHQYQRYVIQCGTSCGGGSNRQAATSGNKTSCTPVNYSVPTCPSGYQYSKVYNTCQKADLETLTADLQKLADLRLKLKQCHDQLDNFDYYLDTKMEIEYNQTEDSVNNFYNPKSDKTSAKVELVRVEENTNEQDQNEDKLGKYSTDIMKPSSKSKYTYYGQFFNDQYKFENGSIPIVVCTYAGPTKICNTVQHDAYADYWYDWYGKTFVAMYEYRLDNGFYKWVRLPEGVSQSTKPTGDYEKYNRFIDIGFPNYPIHFATPGAHYEGLNIKITNIGNNNYLSRTYQTELTNYNHLLPDEHLSERNNNNELLHDCYYVVEDGEPYCPPKGCNVNDDLGSVRIIYRPISLANPFPSIDADGRNTGSNWCTLNSEDDEKDCSNTNESVEKYILNNRNTQADSVYSKEPMYQITLDPALIRRIRDYNKQTNYDDYNMYCSSDNAGKECRSHFVVGGMEETGLATLSDSFSGCGTDADFYACDKLDNIER